jgi:hypothetical protein
MSLGWLQQFECQEIRLCGKQYGNAAGRTPEARSLREEES